MKRSLASRVLLAAAMVFALARCGGDTPTAPGVVAVSLAPPSVTLRVGATVQITSSVTVNGVVTPQTLSFTSDNQAVVSITAGGLVRALTIGTANITAKATTGESGTALVTVIAGLPTSITKTAGDNQSAFTGAAVSVAPSVTVRDSAGNAAAGVSVTFAVASGGGTVTGGAATTNAAGVATAGTFTLGSAAGANTLSATVAGLTPVTFTATGTVAPAASIKVNGGDAQTAPAGSAVPTPPSVLVTTAAGQPSAGVSVTFAVGTGGGSVTGATQTTNAAGIATVGSWTLGAAGANTLIATGAGVGSVTFTATATNSVTLGLSATTLALATNPGGNATGFINVTNTGAGALSGLALGTVTYGPGASNWLSASLNSTTAPATVTIGANAALLAAGTYTATLPVTSASASNSPQIITVTLVVATPSSSVVLVTQPAGTSTGALLSPQPVVRIVDGSNATIASYTGPVTAALAGASGTLSGTTTVNAVSGVATFTNLRVTGVGTFFLIFSSGSAQSANSAGFTIAALPATQQAVVTQPAGAASNVAFTTQPKVELRDVNGALVSNGTATVTVSLDPSSSGTGTLSGTTTATAVNGVAQFTNLKISLAGTYVLSFSTPGLPSVTSSSLTVTVSPPASLAITMQPSGAVTSSVLATQPVVELRDATNARVAGATNAVTATLVGTGGTLSGTTTVSAVNGAATFTDLKVTGAGTYSLTFTSASVTSATSNAFTIAPLAATQLAVSTQPGGAATGANLAPQPVVQVRDASNGVVTGSSASVTAALVGSGGTLSGTTTVVAVNGVATFTDLKVTGTGSYTLTFTSPSLTSATSSSFGVTALPATQLVVNTQPGGAVTGSNLAPQPVVQVRDASNGVVAGNTAAVTAVLNGSGGTLSGSTTVTAVNGVATFTDLKVTGAGTYSLTFTSASVTSATSNAFTITPLPATQLAVSTQPGGAATGANLAPQPVVQVRDASNGVVTGSSAPVTAALVGSGGTLSGTTTVTAVNGVATFTDLKVTGTGSYALTFTSPSLTSATSSSFGITALPATQLVVNTQPGGAVTGSNLAPQPVVQLRDASNGVVAGNTAAVTAVLNGSGGTLSGSTTVTAVNGVATFTDLKVSGAGTYSLTFTSASVTSATSNAFTITPLPATQLAVSTQPGGAATGANLAPQPVVQVRDASNGVVTGSSAPVTAALVGSGGTLSGTTTVTAVNGVATFTDLKVTGTGSYTLTFTSPSLTSATSSSFGITALPATQLAVSTQPGGAASGANLTPQPVVQVRDAGNGVVAGSTATVTASLVGSGGTLSGTTSVAAVNGVATFTDLKVTGAGTYTLSFSSPSLTGATSSSFTITSLPATQLSIQTPPSGGSSGVAFTTQPVVQVRDASNGVVAGSTAPVTATLNGSGGTLSGTTTVNAVNGTATFTDLKISGPGTYTITFSSTGLTPVTTGSLTVGQVATSVIITTQPAGASNGAAFTTQPVAEIRDAAGIKVAAATNSVTATLVGSGGTLGGTTTVNAVAGVATFTNLAVTGPGTYTLTLSSGTLASATSSSFAVTQQATQLAVTTQPAGAVAGANFTTQPVVTVRDAANATVAGATTAVTATIATGSGTLTGTTTVNAVNGVATFSNLRISGGTPPYNVTLSFTATGLTPATSSSFTIAAPPPATIGFNVGASATTTGSTSADLNIPIIVDMSNAQGQNLASIQFQVTWDPTKFDYVNRTNGTFGSGGSFTANTSNTSSGTLGVSIFDTDGFSTGTPTILTVILRPKASGSAGVNASVSVAGSDSGSSIPTSKFVIRALTVNTP